MANHSPANSFFSMLTGKEVTHTGPADTREETGRPDEETSVDSADVNGPMADGTEGVELTYEGKGADSFAGPTTESVHQSDSVMPHEARRVLVHLMRQGSVMASHKSKLFELLCRHEIAIRRHLSEVYLRLVLDQRSGVAFVASADAEYDNDRDAADTGSDSESQEGLRSEESTTLIPKRTLSLYDTLILLVLRKHYQDRESAGEQKITIDIERLESYLTPFLPLTDHASKERKKLLEKVKKMVKRKVLSTLRGAEDRYEITPIIRYVVSAGFLESMLAEYNALASQQACEGVDKHA